MVNQIFIGTYDSRFLIKLAFWFLSFFPYCTSAEFVAASESIVQAYLRGRGLRVTEANISAISNQIGNAAEKGKGKEECFWSRMRNRAKLAPTHKTIYLHTDYRWLPEILKPATL